MSLPPLPGISAETQQRQINALLAAAKDFGMEVQVRNLLDAFNSIQGDEEDARKRLKGLNNFSDSDIDDVFLQVSTQGFNSLDVFDFCNQSGLPAMLVVAADTILQRDLASSSASSSSSSAAAAAADPPSQLKPVVAVSEPVELSGRNSPSDEPGAAPRQSSPSPSPSASPGAGAPPVAPRRPLPTPVRTAHAHSTGSADLQPGNSSPRAPVVPARPPPPARPLPPRPGAAAVSTLALPRADLSVNVNSGPASPHTSASASTSQNTTNLLSPSTSSSGAASVGSSFFATGAAVASGRHRFSVDLIHQFPVVSRQVENGLYSIKRVVALLKKICDAEEEYIKIMSRAASHETAKVDKMSADGMKRSLNTWIGVQEVLTQNAQQHSEYRAKVMQQVVTPLQAFAREAESRRKEIMSEMAALSREMKAISDNVAKQKRKGIEILLNYKLAMEGGDRSKAESSGGVFSKLSRQLKALSAEPPEVLKQRASDQCNLYLEAISAANMRRKLYRERDLPRVFEQLQLLEASRLEVLKEHLTAFTLIYHDLVSPLEGLSSKLVHSVAAMDTTDDLDKFVENWVSVHGEPPKPVDYQYDLPTNAEELRKGRWDLSMELKSNSDSVFGCTLQDVMKLQQEKYASATVPVILTTLIQSILQLNGPSLEGIFRISPGKSSVDSLHREFDKGNYEVKSETAHVPAALLKEWFRELAEPLVPAEHYQPLIELAKEEVVPINKVMAVWGQVPELNRLVVDELVKLLATVEAQSAVNKMTIDNLAIVFAPSFMRCESDDPQEMLTNSRLEVKAITALLTGLIRQAK